MKIFLLAVCLFISPFLTAQMNYTLSPESSVFYHETMKSVKPEIAAFIEKKSEQLFQSQIDGDSLIQGLKKEAGFKKMSDENLKAISLLILICCSHKIDKELKTKVLQLQKQEVEEMNFDKTAPLLERKSIIARQVWQWFGQMEDQTAALKNLM